MEGGVPLNGSEFVYAACGESEAPNALHLAPKFNETLHDSLPSPDRPMILFLLTIDSYSRSHAYRKLPKTIKLLNDL
jgi:hypothetical protein